MKKKAETIPNALTIAGSDSGAGAGIQADLKTFAALGVHGTCALTCITAQNPKNVASIYPLPVKVVMDQIKAVVHSFRPIAVKTGMLCTAEIISRIADFLSSHPIPLIVDPVIAASSGKTLLNKRSLKILEKELFPLATLLTPNLHEAEIILGHRLTRPSQLREAAQEIYYKFGSAVLVKGGHLKGMREAVDFFFDGSSEITISSPFLKNGGCHGTGCAYSAAIAAFLCHGHRLEEAVVRAKNYITGAIFNQRKCRTFPILDYQFNALKLTPGRVKKLQ